MNLYTVLFTVERIADMLMVNGETIRHWIKNGKLHTTLWFSQKDGYFITEDDFVTFLSKNEKYNKIYHKLRNDDIEDYRVIDLIRDKLYGVIPAKEYSEIIVMLYGKNRHDLLFKHVSTPRIINIVSRKCDNPIVTDGIVNILTSLNEES